MTGLELRPQDWLSKGPESEYVCDQYIRIPEQGSTLRAHALECRTCALADLSLACATLSIGLIMPDTCLVFLPPCQAETSYGFEMKQRPMEEIHFQAMQRLLLCVERLLLFVMTGLIATITETTKSNNNEMNNTQNKRNTKKKTNKVTTIIMIMIN